MRGGRVIAWDHRMANPSRYAYAENGRPPVESELYPDDFPAGFVPELPLDVHPRSRAASRAAPGAPRCIRPTRSRCRASWTSWRTRRAGTRWRSGWSCSEPPRQLDYKGHGGPVFDTGRLAGVLRLAADKAGWGSPLPAGRARGIAGHFTFGSYAAHVVEVSRDAPDGFRVERVVVAVDCGLVVNRSGAEAQVQGGVLDGSRRALYGGDDGGGGPGPGRRNFDRYRLTPDARSASGGDLVRLQRGAAHRAWASRRCRRWRPPWPTRSSRSPASGPGGCR